MKVRKCFFGLVRFICFLTGASFIFGQEDKVPNVPDEVRVLSSSFKEEYKSEAYNYVESISMWGKMRAWMIDKIASWFSVNDNSALHFFDNLEFLIYLLIIAGVVYIIVKMILNKEARWLFKRKKDDTNELSYEIGENIHEVNFDTLITEALKNKDYRLAVRYNYLLLLKKLDQFNIIKFDDQKTTYDYQIELEGTSHAPAFNKATYYYTYIWYGEFIIDEQEYNTAFSVYAQLLKQFKNA